MFKYNFREYSEEYVKRSIFKADALILKQIDSNKRVLEVWCASWYMSKYMKEELNCTITWVEYSKEAWDKAKKYQEKIYILDLDKDEFLNSVKWNYDIIIFPAVLEHLKNPEKVLKKILQLLNEGWKIIISLPNIAHYTIRFNLFFWRFDYKTYWIMDNTHLKFYTYKSIKELIKDTWLKIERFHASFPFPLANFLEKIPILNQIIYFIINKILFRIFWEELIFTCRKKWKNYQ